MTELDALLASYVDLARHGDPLRFPDGAPPDLAHRLGRFDAGSLHQQSAALRSVANAVEDLEVAARDDEIDRTMLLDTLRGDIAACDGAATGATANPARPLAHLDAALIALMGEDFDLAAESALRDRIAAIPSFLDALRDDPRRAPLLLVERAVALAERVERETLDLAGERLEEAAVQPALVAMAEHRRWLAEPDRVGDEAGWGLMPFEARLAVLNGEPLGARGTLRVLELRRAGVERSLRSAATELGCDDPHECARRMRQESCPAPDVLAGYWSDEWKRVTDALRGIGFPVEIGEAPDVAGEVRDGWSMAVWAVRGQAAAMFEAARAANARPVRRDLRGPALVPAWGRSVSALVRATDVFGLPERRLMMSHLALCEAVAAETDLMVHAGFATLPEAIDRIRLAAGLDASGADTILAGILDDPLRALAAALAHEAWQGWYADVGGSPAGFSLRALAAGGLSVPLARWAAEGAAP